MYILIKKYRKVFYFIGSRKWTLILLSMIAKMFIE